MILSICLIGKSISVFILLIVLPNGKCESENRINNYEGYKVYELQKETLYDQQYIDGLHRNASQYHLDFLRLNKLLNDNSQVMVPPEFQERFEHDLRLNGMRYVVYIDNVKRVIDREKLLMNLRRSDADENLNFNTYNRYEAINNYLDKLATLYPQIVKIDIAGHSFEGRPIKTVQISTSFSAGKPIVFIDAGIHAREWIAPATALYIIHELVENFSKYRELLVAFDFIIMPLVNPDGYEYSHTKNRLWRKTRKPYKGCYGADANRNFDFSWCGEGTSVNPCDDTYCGPAPFSESEAVAVRNVLLNVKDRCKLYLSLHSYGSYILHPWGHKKLVPKNVNALTDIGLAAANAIKHATGRQYEVGASSILLYPAAGGSDDYAMAIAKIPFAYTIELPQGGELDFDPPPQLIKPLVEESWIGIRAMIMKVRNSYLN